MTNDATEWIKITAQECYNICWIEEGGEGECARAIRLKFNLKENEET